MEYFKEKFGGDKKVGHLMQRLLPYIIIWIFTSPTISNAFDYISLNDHERKLIEHREIIVREVETDGKDGKTFEVIGYINASKDTILQILTEYEKYPEFMPNVSHIKVVEQRGKESILNYTLTLPLGKIKKYRVKVTVASFDNQYSMIHWELRDWPELKEEETIRDTTGYWRIEEKTQDVCMVQYHVYTDPGPIPFGLGWIVDILSKDSVPEVFLKTKSKIEEIYKNNTFKSGL